MSGRELATLLPRRPSPAGSTLEVVTVPGVPVYVERMPESSQPRSAWPTKPRLCWKMGSVYTQFSVSVLAVAGDRKSTRLNSSHLVISYAVFCLKKKKKTTHHIL